jgi:hypothetical protein
MILRKSGVQVEKTSPLRDFWPAAALIEAYVAFGDFLCHR